MLDVLWSFLDDVLDKGIWHHHPGDGHENGGDGTCLRLYDSSKNFWKWEWSVNNFKLNVFDNFVRILVLEILIQNCLMCNCTPGACSDIRGSIEQQDNLVFLFSYSYIKNWNLKFSCFIQSVDKDLSLVCHLSIYGVLEDLFIVSNNLSK